MATFWRSRRRISHAWAPLSMSVNDDNFDCFSLKVHEIENFFGFDFEISLRFYLEFLLRSETKRSKIQVFFSFFPLFFTFFRFFHFFSLNFCFASIFSLNFRLFYLRFLLQIFGVSHRSESCEIRLFFHFQAKQNFRFSFKFRFQSESEGAP